jgi:hypothetical protein
MLCLGHRQRVVAHQRCAVAGLETAPTVRFGCVDPWVEGFQNGGAETWRWELSPQREMADHTPPDRLEPVRRLVAATKDPELRELVSATLDILEQDTKQVLDQTHIARDIAARTSAGDWFATTELREIKADAEFFLRTYKHQREELKGLKAALQSDG